MLTLGIIDLAYSGEALLSWTPPTTNVDGTPLTDLSGYKIYYGTATGTYNSTLDVGNTATSTVMNLTEKTTYYFAVTAYDTTGNESSYSNEVSKTIPDLTPPVISGTTIGNITGISADITWTTDEAASSQIEYGITTGYGTSTPLDSTMVTSHTVTLTGLLPFITYHFRINSLDTNGNLSNSSDFTLTTPDLFPPTGTISINSNAAYTNNRIVTLTLSCTDNESGCGQMEFSEDGLTWSAWEPYTSNKSYTLPNVEGTKTIYVTYQDNAGNISNSLSNSIVFDKTYPKISSVTKSNVSTNSATISWATDESANSLVDYGTSTSYGSSTTLDTNLISSHIMVISGLTPSTTYHFRVTSKDIAGNVTLSGDNSFTTSTPPDTTAPVISGVSIINITTTDATVTWTTDESSTSQIEYGTSILYEILSNLDNNLATSHTVILSGLTPSVTYNLRVMSVDVAGNQGMLAGNSFTTLRTIQPETPAPITDFRVRPGATTKNSVILEWTATGADGTEGTATIYDLRMSKFRIIEDGTTAKQGEINFSRAAKVTGIIAPAIAGSAESLQVNLLVPNSIYFFAIKAIDDKGNISSMSNVINGNNVPALPVTALRNGFTMISVPLNPQTTDAQTLLSGIVGSPAEVFWWRSNGIANGSGSFISATDIVPGYGYLLKSNTDNAILNISGTVITDTSRTIPLQSGWNMIGNPYPQDIPLMNTYIKRTDTGELKVYEDAVIAGWVSNALYTYNGRTYSFVMYNSASLKIWQGYWIAVLADGQYELVITKP